jgi:hypothetical protein
VTGDGTVGDVVPGFGVGGCVTPTDALSLERPSHDWVANANDPSNPTTVHRRALILRKCRETVQTLFDVVAWRHLYNRAMRLADNDQVAASRENL